MVEWLFLVIGVVFERILNKNGKFKTLANIILDLEVLLDSSNQEPKTRLT